MAKEQKLSLSQDLKYPITAKAQKIFNVQVALDALRDVRGIGTFTDKVSAEDVVNGHREKTVALLWGLSSKWGLDRLIDFKDLRREVHRLQAVKRGENRDDSFDALAGSDADILQRWAQMVAWQSGGLKVTNFTTQFVNGKVFSAIVDAYCTYLPDIPHSRHLLSDKLSSIGCSASFGEQHF